MSDPTVSSDLDAFRMNRRREREERGLRLSGPCFVCRTETEYGGHDHYGLYSRGGNKWLDRQFEPDARTKHLEVFAEGIGFDRTRNALFNQFVCSACQDAARRQWPLKEKHRKEKWEQDRIQAERDRAETRFRNTWRTPGRNEFEISSGRRDFQVRSLDRRPMSVVFRWRTCVSKECLGDIPAQRVGMWVNKHLRAHYYGWEFGDAAGDLFGPGFAFWMETAFQRDLARLAPDATWYAKTKTLISRRTEEAWPGLDSLHICNVGQGQEYPTPCVIHTVWPNGSVYAQLRNFYILRDVVEFAWENLHVDIRSGE